MAISFRGLWRMQYDGIAALARLVNFASEIQAGAIANTGSDEVGLA
jgi:hypothetical protein